MLNYRKLFITIYCFVLIILPIVCWVLLYMMPDFEWDTAKVLLMSLLTLMGWFGGVFCYYYTIVQNKNVDNNSLYRDRVYVYQHLITGKIIWIVAANQVLADTVVNVNYGNIEHYSLIETHDNI